MNSLGDDDDDDDDDLRMPSTRMRRASSISFDGEEMPVAPSRTSEPRPLSMFGARNAAANPATNDPTQPLLDLAELNRRPFSAS